MDEMDVDEYPVDTTEVRRLAAKIDAGWTGLAATDTIRALCNALDARDEQIRQLNQALSDEIVSVRKATEAANQFQQAVAGNPGSAGGRRRRARRG